MQLLTSKLTATVTATSVLMLVLPFFKHSLKCCKPLTDKPTNRVVTYYHNLDSPDKRSFCNYGKYVTFRGGGNTHPMTPALGKGTNLGHRTFAKPLSLLHPNTQQLHIANMQAQLHMQKYKAWGFMRNNHQCYSQEKRSFLPQSPDHQ